MRSLSLIWALLFLTTIISTHGSIIKLFNRFHFYELLIQKEIHNRIDPAVNSYKYTVNGESNCFPSLNKSFNSIGNRKPVFSVKAQAAIYSNFELTLSFLNEVEFKVLNDLEGQLQGIQLEFEAPSGEVSCLQIIPDSKLKIDFKELQFTFTIKDPVFISQKKDFIFYFGKVHIKSLIACQDDQLCAVDASKTSSEPIGVSTDKEISYQPLQIDLCDSHVLKQTCIKVQTLNSQPYLIIIHPLPDEFGAIYADLNVLELDEVHKIIIRDAIKKEQAIVQIGDGVYSTKYLTEESGLQQVMIHNLVSYQYQKLNRDVIIKLVPKIMDVKYLGILRESNDKNKCQSSDHVQCFCEKTNSCRNCYSYSDVKDIEKSLNYVPLDGMQSRACKSNSFFDPYEFEETKLRTTFQSQSLFNHRKPDYSIHQRQFSNNNIFFNRNLFPHVCFNAQESSDNKFSITLQFVDHHKTARTSLLDYSEFEVTAYSFDYSNGQTPTTSKKLFPIKIHLIANQTVKLTESTRLHKLNDMISFLSKFSMGKYLIEILPKVKNKLCPDESHCIDESPQNNQIQCMPCNKLIVFFPLTENSINQKDSDSLGTCIGNDPEFENILWSKEQNYIVVSNETINRFQTPQLVSGIVPSSFKIDSVRLPYYELNKRTSDLNAIKEMRVFMLVFMPLLFLVFVILGTFFLDFYFKYKAKMGLLKMNYKKRVLFYISIKSNEKKQEMLKELLKKFDLIKKIFPDITFTVVTCNTNKILRAKHLEEADIICYICCTRSEIENLNKPVRIGLNQFEHEYNRIQSGQYKWKSLNLTFNRKVLMLPSYLQQSLSSDDILTKSSREAKFSEITMTTFAEKSGTNSTIQQQQQRPESSDSSNLVRYLKLPEQNMELIWMLMPQNDLNLIKGNNNHKSHWRPIYALYTCFNSFYKRSLSSISYRRYNRTNYNLYCKYLIKTVNDKLSDEITSFLKENDSVLSEEISNSNLTEKDFEEVIEDDTLFADELDVSTAMEQNRQELNLQFMEDTILLADK